MRDLSNDRALLSINSMTVKPWSLEQLIDGCARAGLSAISPWRDIVQACGVERAGTLIRAHGMSGKFLPYKYYGNSGNVPEYGFKEE